MKKTALVLASLSMLAIGIGHAQAQPRFDDGHPPGQQDHRDGPPRGPDQRGYDQRGPEQRGPEQRGYDHRDGDRHDWQRGERVDRDAWRRGGRVDYRDNHLRPPPRGYEWREVNGAYILGAIASGIVADVILNHR